MCTFTLTLCVHFAVIPQTFIAEHFALQYIHFLMQLISTATKDPLPSDRRDNFNTTKHDKEIIYVNLPPEQGISVGYVKNKASCITIGVCVNYTLWYILALVRVLISFISYVGIEEKQ